MVDVLVFNREIKTPELRTRALNQLLFKQVFSLKFLEPLENKNFYLKKQLNDFASL